MTMAMAAVTMMMACSGGIMWDATVGCSGGMQSVQWWDAVVAARGGQ